MHIWCSAEYENVEETLLNLLSSVKKVCCYRIQVSCDMSLILQLKHLLLSIGYPSSSLTRLSLFSESKHREKLANVWSPCPNKSNNKKPSREMVSKTEDGNFTRHDFEGKP